MSRYADTLPADRLAPFAAAMAAAGQRLADMGSARDELAATGGPEAVAEAAHWPGHPLTVDEIARKYQRMQDEARHPEAGAA